MCSRHLAIVLYCDAEGGNLTLSRLSTLNLNYPPNIDIFVENTPPLIALIKTLDGCDVHFISGVLHFYVNSNHHRLVPLPKIQE